MAKIMHRQLAALALAFILAGALSDSTLAANTSDAQTEMLRSARMWEAKDRPDLARTMLEKALLTKEDATVLLLLICLELRSNNTKIAAKYLQQLEQHYPLLSAWEVGLRKILVGLLYELLQSKY